MEGSLSFALCRERERQQHAAGYKAIDTMRRRVCEVCLESKGEQERERKREREREREKTDRGPLCDELVLQRHCGNGKAFFAQPLPHDALGTRLVHHAGRPRGRGEATIAEGGRGGERARERKGRGEEALLLERFGRKWKGRERERERER